ncbi:MAG: fluoride efflux transporter CrcB [Hydrogenophilaceae bacterium]|jgi:CrcB protein|nr:fluoride efflux transporter CrcB [Hydrogenophilaceae bacterium]
MQSLLLVAAGGAVGAMARYGAGALAVRLGLAGFPWSTLAVNLLGGFAMGLLAGWLAEGSPALRLLLGVGVLGGFTTFSAFSIDVVRLMEANELMPALAYVLASVIGAIGACWLGLILARGGA